MGQAVWGGGGMTKAMSLQHWQPVQVLRAAFFAALQSPSRIGVIYLGIASPKYTARNDRRWGAG